LKLGQISKGEPLVIVKQVVAASNATYIILTTIFQVNLS